MRHVALLAPRPLYPERSGGEIRVATLLRRLSDRWRFTVLTLARPESRLLAEAAAAFVERSTGARVRLAWRTPGARVPDGLPAVSRDHADPAFERALEALAAQDPVDLVALEFTQLAQYARDAARLAPVVLTEHDSSVLRPADSYLRGAGAAPAERARVAAHLREAFGHCARVVAVSDADAARLARWPAPMRWPSCAGIRWPSRSRRRPCGAPAKPCSSAITRITPTRRRPCACAATSSR